MTYQPTGVAWPPDTTSEGIGGWDWRGLATADAGSHDHRHPQSAVGVLGLSAVVELALTVTYGQPIVDIAQDVQHHVIAELRDTVGLERVAVNVTIDDILPPPGRSIVA